MDLKYSNVSLNQLSVYLMKLHVHKNYMKQLYVEEPNIHTLLQIKNIVNEIRFVQKRLDISINCYYD